ncbi:MAG TPA: hypothetical protein P5060_03555 [Candidatus Absconditabacterales bacterium]|nr:hypothetical protein [Candidatus Absconditabacterales bacterium]
MLRFLRRWLIILIFLTIVFLVYRYINPEGASKLVDRIKSIPERFANLTESGANQDMENTGDTIVIIEDQNNTGEVVVNTGDEDLTWLEELNQEIESILSKDNDENFDEEEKDTTIDLTDCVSYFDGCNTCMVVSGEISGCTRMYCETNEEAKCLKYIGDDINEEEIIEEDGDNQDEEINSGQSDQQGLDSADYQDIKDVFGNLVE